MSSKLEGVFEKSVESQVDALRKKRQVHEDAIEKLDRQIEEAIAGQSPIKPGDIIEWDTGKRIYRGRVVRVRTGYRGEFNYRCHIVSKSGASLGFANVEADRMPLLVQRGKKKFAKPA